MDSEFYRRAPRSGRRQLLIGLAFAVLTLCSRAPGRQADAGDTLHSFGSFREASALAVDAGGAIYVADRGAHQIVKFSASGTFVQRVGTYGWGSDAFDRPSDLTINNGLDLYVADYGNRRVRRFDRNLTLIEDLPLGGPNATDAPASSGSRPVSVTQTREGDLFVLDGEERRVLKLTANGIEGSFGGLGSGEGTLRAPSRVRALGSGVLVVKDDSTLVMFDKYGNYLRRVPLASASDFHAFTAAQESVYIVEGDSLQRFDPVGDWRTILKLPDGLDDLSALVDVVVLADHVVFLFKARGLIVPLAAGPAR